MLTRTDPNGVVTTWTYTPLNHTASASYSGGSAHSVSYGYDANGNKTAMSDATGSSSDVYDPFGELTSSTNGAGQVTGYGYTADGLPSSITYPLPTNATWATTDTVNYTYDHADLLTGVADFNGNQISLGNTADGLPNSLGLAATGDTIATTYDNTDVPSIMALKNGSSTLQSFTYSDAPSGNILSEADTPTSSQSPAVYTYDPKARITSMTPGTGSVLNYGFDASSNLTTLPDGGTGSYDNAGELTSSVKSGTTTNYAYNADGRRLTATQGPNTIASGTWNGAGQLTSYTDAASNMTATTYDGDGLRATDTTGSASESFVWAQFVGTPRLIMDSQNAYIYDGNGVPAEQVSLSTGTVTYLNCDFIGSIRGTVSASGSLTGTAAYYAWGGPESPGGLSASTPFGFSGGYTDPTGLIYLMSRYYDPASGQFISLDPAILQTYQPYEYPGGDPISKTDPTGEWVYGRCLWAPWGTTGMCAYLLGHTASLVLIRAFDRESEFFQVCYDTTDKIPYIGDYVSTFCGLAAVWFKYYHFTLVAVLDICGGEHDPDSWLGFLIPVARLHWWYFGWHYSHWYPVLPITAFCWNRRWG